MDKNEHNDDTKDKAAGASTTSHEKESNKDNEEEGGINYMKIFQVAVGIGAAAVAGYGLYKTIEKLTEEDIPNLVFDQDELQKKLKNIIEDTELYPVVAFNCQFTHMPGEDRSKIALIQIASCEGEILLIETKKFHHYPHFPQEIIDFLTSANIIKVGIEPARDARYLFDDFGIEVHSTFDLRFLAEEVGHRPEGLSSLAGKILDLNIEETMPDWDVIDEGRIRYAEKTAKASIDIFKELFSKLDKEPTRKSILDHFEDDLDKQYVKVAVDKT